MLAKKSKYRISVILVLLPVFFLYVYHSSINYHSHVYANGISITHSHPIQDCEKNANNNTSKNSEKQIIVIHAFSLDLGDELPNPVSMDFVSFLFSKVILPQPTLYFSEFYIKSTGRSPPVC